MSSTAFNVILEAADKGMFPRTRKWAWARLYNLMSRFWSDHDWRFMNYGYEPANEKKDFHLSREDEAERAFIGLYFQAVDGIDLHDKDVLEVGCGRGGGTAYVSKYFSPKKTIGVDYSRVTVERAKKLNPKLENLEYQWGDAEKLPFPDASFDAVVNIESSHCYANMAAFVREVERVLKPGGIFSWADMRGKSMIKELDACFENSGLEPVSQSSLGEGVVKALDSMNDRKRDRINKIPIAGKFFKEFAGMQGSSMYKWLKNGNVLYLSRRYKKLE